MRRARLHLLLPRRRRFGSSGFGKKSKLPGIDELTRLEQISVSLV
jgi:hypothetical protein